MPIEARRARASKASRAAVAKTRRFTDAQVRKIRSSKKGIKQQAQEYGVAVATISYIVNRRTYQDVE